MRLGLGLAKNKEMTKQRILVVACGDISKEHIILIDKVNNHVTVLVWLWSIE